MNKNLFNKFSCRIEDGFGLVYDREKYKIFKVDIITADIIQRISGDCSVHNLAIEYSCTETDILNFVKKIQKSFQESEKTDDDVINDNIAEYQTKDVSLSAPIFVFWDFTKKCNLKCRHCYESATAKFPHPEFLKLKEYIIQFKSAGVFEIILAGGEPFLYPHISSLVKEITDAGIVIPCITTNGTILRENDLKNIIGKVQVIQVSLDGSNQDVHENFRGVKGCFSQSIKNIKILKEHGFNVRLGYTINHLNKNNIVDFLNLASSLNVDSVKIGAIMPTGNAKDYKTITLDEYREIDNQINSLKSKVNFKIYNDFFFSFLCEKNSENKIKQCSYKCGATNELVSVDSEGDVYPCSFAKHPALKMGNLNDTTLLDLYKNRNTLFQKLDPLKMECKRCKYFQKSCNGGCRVHSFYAKNDFYGRDPMCPSVM